MKKFLPEFLIVFLFFFSKIILAENLLSNPGFEDGLSYWQKDTSTAIFELSSDYKKNGNFSVFLTKSSSGYATFSQIVNISPEKYYYLSGWVFLNDDKINNIKLRFYWLDENNNSIPSEEVEQKEKSGDFINISTAPAISPANAIKAKIQGYVYLNTGAPLIPPMFDDLIFEEASLFTPTPTTFSLPTSSFTPTQKPTPQKSTYKINDVKDNEGKTLSNVKIYIDDVYIHHYVPEVLTFCEGCICDSYVACGFGTHEIRLEKSGYEDWITEITINAGENKEINPVMNIIPTQTPKPTNTPIENTQAPTKNLTPTPTKKNTPTQKPTLRPTPKPAILGRKTASLSAFLISPTTSKEKNVKNNVSSFKKDLPKILIVFGILSTFAMVLISFFPREMKD